MDRGRLPFAILATLVVVLQVVATSAGAAPQLDGSDVEPARPSEPADPDPSVPVVPPDGSGDDGPAPVEVPNHPPVELGPTDGGVLTDDDPPGGDDPADARCGTETPAEPPSPTEVPAGLPSAAPTESSAVSADEETAPPASTWDPAAREDTRSLAGEVLAISVATDLGLGTVVVGASSEPAPFAMTVTNVSVLGWQVTVDGPDLVHADDGTLTIPRTALFLTGGSGGGLLADAITPHAGSLPEAGPLLLVRGGAAASGELALVDGPTVRLDVPADAVPGLYRTTLTYTIMSWEP